MRITEKAARTYLTEDAVREIACKAATELAHELPGSDPLTLVPTHSISIALTGRTIAGLAVATDIALADTSIRSPRDIADNARQAIALISLWATTLEQTPPGDSVRVHEAQLQRTIRELDKAAQRLADGALPPDSADPDAVIDALTDNIDRLRAEL
ncbi:hypothetical protein [Nocardia brasiliensis]|uniref:hypothetical protein n=1 Tax=Nocardia brasiliensis TaxID=37326 RepID=UPI0024562C62|nr:hypothetical protein [Nocardia brasiliensis]